MSVFQFDNYKKYIRYRIESMASRGRGQYTKIANYLGVSPTIVTQVLTGDREFTPEQGGIRSLKPYLKGSSEYEG